MYVPFKLNKEYKFFGVDNQVFKIDDLVIEVKEDPDDGYRSYMGSVDISNDPDTLLNLIFFGQPLDTVIIVEASGKDKRGEYFVGYEVRSTKDNHMWLQFGTDNYDDYYPFFVFNYYPRT